MPGNPPSQLRVPTDDHERRVVDDVRQYGWHVIGIAEDEEGPAFAYSIGLTHSFGHPEVIMFGLPVETMFQAVNVIGEEVRAGRGFEHRDESDGILDGYSVFFRTVARDQYRESSDMPAGFMAATISTSCNASGRTTRTGFPGIPISQPH
jgi:hypothetical protein